MIFQDLLLTTCFCITFALLCALVTQIQSHGAAQAAGRVAPARDAVCAPGHGDLQRQVADGRRLAPHQSVGGIQELGVRHRLTGQESG